VNEFSLSDSTLISIHPFETCRKRDMYSWPSYPEPLTVSFSPCYTFRQSRYQFGERRMLNQQKKQATISKRVGKGGKICKECRLLWCSVNSSSCSPCSWVVLESAYCLKCSLSVFVSLIPPPLSYLSS
jgi:hypothetical protein